MRTIKVVGAGFSGLVAAYFLVKQGFGVRIFDSSSRVGGLIGTIRTEHGPVETAANGIRNSARLEAMCADIGVPLQGMRRKGRARYIYRGRPRQWPLTVSDDLRIALGLMRNARHPRPQPFETIDAWGRRVLGDGATEYFLSPALGGIYAGDSKQLSASLIFHSASLPDELKTSRPERARKRGTVAPFEGMQELLDGLVEYLERAGAEFHLDQQTTADPNEPTVICTNARAAAQFLNDISPEVSDHLRGIEMLPVVTATCFYHQEAGPAKGFGCLFPRGEGFWALGVLLNSCIFENRGPNHSETWIFGGALDRNACAMNDDELSELIANERERLYRRHDEPLGIHITRWPTALPHYSIELERILTTLPPMPTGFALVGNYLGRIGLSGIIERAAQVAARFKETA